MRAESGSDVEFAGFVRAHTAALVRVAYLLTGSAAAAEDLVQDTFVRLYPKWFLVEGADAPLAYVRRAMTNGFINTRRTRASRLEFVVSEVPESRADRDTGPDSFAQLADRDEIWHRLADLSAQQRAALVLRYFADLPDDEIATALGCRPGTVRSLISRGLAVLRAQYREAAR